MILLRVSLAQIGAIFAKTWSQMWGACLVGVFIFGLAYVFNYSGMAGSLASAFSKLGVAFIVVAPILGFIGVALSGSNTSTNAMFGAFQALVGKVLGFPLLLLPTLNSVGAEIGKPIAPQTASVGVSTSRFVRNEGEVIRHNFGWMHRSARLSRHYRAWLATSSSRTSRCCSTRDREQQLPRRRRRRSSVRRSPPATFAIRRSLQLENKMRRLRQYFVCFFFVAIMVTLFGIALTAEAAFPFDQELMLDASPMRGSKRIPIIEIAENGAASIQLWCASVRARANVAADSITIVAGEAPPAQCAPERQSSDDESPGRAGAGDRLAAARRRHRACAAQRRCGFV